MTLRIVPPRVEHERADVLLYVQHLLGIGHVRRAAVLARAFHRAGLKVVFVTGGLPIRNLGLEGIEMVQLPPARSEDETFKVILDESGRPIDTTWQARRRKLLLDVYRRASPRVVMTELYPFGRRKMNFELEPLIEAARAASPPALIACSLRDILNRPEQPEKAAWMADRFTRLYDLLYVHGDPRVCRLEDSFPEFTAVSDRLHYTGYVTEAGTPREISREGAGSGEVIVSAGGGAVGMALLHCALAARPLSPLAQAPWRLLVGPNATEEAFGKLAEAAPSGVTVERARSDFVELLSRARLSISQGGYNTLLEVLATGVPGVVVPFAGATETEQTQRSRLLAERGLITLVDEVGLSPQSLVTGIIAALERADIRKDGGERQMPFRLDGAEETARHLVALLEATAE